MRSFLFLVDGISLADICFLVRSHRFVERRFVEFLSNGAQFVNYIPCHLPDLHCLLLDSLLGGFEGNYVAQRCRLAAISAISFPSISANPPTQLIEIELLANPLAGAIIFEKMQQDLLTVYPSTLRKPTYSH